MAWFGLGLGVGLGLGLGSGLAWFHTCATSAGCELKLVSTALA